MAATERRSDIDSLRALAVTGVILYHLDLSWIPGGFLGVDVFFVLSGFLISQIILSKSEVGNFSFFDFYIRRFRRLVPALLSTIIISIFASIYFLPDSFYNDFKNTVMTSVFYISNIYFYFESGYFDIESSYKPLLHTWSLSVEEQFYLFWPFFLFIFRRWRPILCITIIGVLSLAAAETVLYHSKSAAFYLFPFRIFEFAAGALCVALVGHDLKIGTTLRTILLSVFVLGISASFFLLDKTDGMPGLLSLLVVVPTVFAIAVGVPNHVFNNIVGRPIIYIGRISYSLYLVHWPIIIFYKLHTNFGLNIYEVGVLLGVNLISGMLMYHLIERPFHYGRFALGKIASLGLFPLSATLAFGALLLSTDIRAAMVKENEQVQALLQPIKAGRKQTLIPIFRSTDYASASSEGVLHIVIVGDSHAMDVTHALYRQFGSDRRLTAVNHKCFPLYLKDWTTAQLEDLYSNYEEARSLASKCRPYHENLGSRLQALQPDLIVFSELWEEKAVNQLTNSLTGLKGFVDAPMILLGRNLTFSDRPTSFVPKISDVREVNFIANRDYIDTFGGIKNEDMDKILKEISVETGVFFIPKTDLVCPTQICELVFNNQIMYVDKTHWTLAGMDEFGRRLVENHVWVRVTSSLDK